MSEGGRQLARLDLDGNQIALKLVMDEPTNDLDIETLELFEPSLVDHHGTVLLVSHDLAGPNDVVTSTLVIERPPGQRDQGGYHHFSAIPPNLRPNLG